MGIFVGERMNSRAAKVALKLNYVVRNIISPRLIGQFRSLSEAGFELRHATGIDTGVALAVRTGLRAANDTIWVGRAPNLAARLSELREHPHASFITAAVYNRIGDDVKYSAGEAIWERRNLEWRDETVHIYRSSWTQTP
jgi:class 3 adenylate cyclase